MAIRNYSNITNVGTLSGAVGTGDTTLPINGGWSNLPSFPFYIIVDRGNATEECMLATGGNATALTVTRAYDGSSASSHGTNATVEVAVLAEFFTKADNHVEASTNVHGLSGGAAVVGTTSTQTLTNKTINSSVVSVAHSTSPAASQAVQVAADAATARDGFVWTKTASATGAAFKATSSGTNRFVVDSDGKVVLNSTAGADKALAIQESATERFSILNDGTVDAGLQAVGATADRVTIRNRPTQNALRIKDQAGLNVFTVGSAGNVDASGYVAAVGNVSSTAAVSAGTTLSSGTTASVGTNLTVGGTAAVTGASTLTGDSTWPLPASSTTPRLTVNSRTGGFHLRGIRQDGTVTYEIGADGGGTANGKWFIHDKNSPIVAKVTSTAVVPSPVTGMIVFDISDKTLKEYNGATWDAVGRYGTEYAGARGAFYYQSGTAQSIPAVSDQRISFNSNLRTVADITTATVSSGTEFTINRSGLWTITASTRFSTGSDDTERYLAIANSASTGTRFAEMSSSSNTSTAALPIALNVSKTIPVTAGDKICILAYHGGNTVGSGSISLDLTYLRSTSVSFVWEGV